MGLSTPIIYYNPIFDYFYKMFTNDQVHFVLKSDAYPLYDSETTSKAINLTIHQELLWSFRWLHIIETAGGGAFVGHILAVWRRKRVIMN